MYLDRAQLTIYVHSLGQKSRNWSSFYQTSLIRRNKEQRNKGTWLGFFINCGRIKKVKPFDTLPQSYRCSTCRVALINTWDALDLWLSVLWRCKAMMSARGSVGSVPGGPTPRSGALNAISHCTAVKSVWSKMPSCIVKSVSCCRSVRVGLNE